MIRSTGKDNVHARLAGLKARREFIDREFYSLFNRGARFDGSRDSGSIQMDPPLPKAGDTPPTFVQDFR
jgi:hypothetical protein